MKFSWKIALRIVVPIAFIALFGFVKYEQAHQKCKQVVFEIDHNQGLYFLTNKKLTQFLEANSARNPLGKARNTINLQALEQALEANPFVANAEVNMAFNGTLNIKIQQKKPVMRVFNHEGASFYVDAFGHKIPLCADFTHRVVVASGVIIDAPSQPDTLISGLGKSALQVALLLQRDSLLSAIVDQIYINTDKQIELSTRLGNAQVIVGDTTMLAQKMNNLMAFYGQAYKHKNWNLYATIDLRYKGQVVCTKSNIYETN